MGVEVGDEVEFTGLVVLRPPVVVEKLPVVELVKPPVLVEFES